MKLYCYLLIIFIFVGCFAAHAELPKKVKVSVYQIEGLLEFKKQALPFNQIFEIIDQRTTTKFDYQFYYPLRAVEIFDNNEADCMFPGSILVYDLKKPPIESIPLQTAEAYFIALENVHTANLIDNSQPALNIGYRRGNTYGGNISKLTHHNLMPLNNGADIRELLARKRIDVFLGYLPDSFALIHEKPDQPLIYSEESFFYRQNDSFLCRDTPEIRLLLEQLNLVIQNMHDSGEIQKILEVLSQHAANPTSAELKHNAKL